MRRRLFRLLWQRYRDRILDSKGFRGHVVKKDEEFLSLFIELYLDERRVLLSLREMYNIYRLSRRATQIDGDFAEVGVFQGGSARIICEAKNDETPLHLFDTFEGMPEVDRSIDKTDAGVCSGTSLENVREYLKGFPNVQFYKGIFPRSADGTDATTARFAFVNLDVDIYESTLNGLKFFYPKMTPGGFILSHDYQSVAFPGVRKAFNEFMADKPEPVIDLWDSQALIVKN